MGENYRLIGEYNHKLEDKARLIIPAKFRPSLANSFVSTKPVDIGI